MTLPVTLIVSCDDNVVRTHRGGSYDYELSLPPAFLRQDVTGIDSKVEEFRSDEVVISTDFGHYSSPPECSAQYQFCKVDEERIAERDALVGMFEHGSRERANEPKPFRIWVHVIVDRSQGLNLNLFARCDTRRACDDALSYFRRVRIFRLPNRPVENLAPPAPPPRATKLSFYDAPHCV